jgi:hypothetical protein
VGVSVFRYVISSKADDYNQAFDNHDQDLTVNGHQLIAVKIQAKWLALNTSKGECSALPDGFSPDSVAPPHNIPVRFAAYPDVTFLLRKIGQDYTDDCYDNSLAALMNIYRSGNAQTSEFKWERFVEADSRIAP